MRVSWNLKWPELNLEIWKNVAVASEKELDRDEEIDREEEPEQD
jgi:hypothetical protein